MTAWASRIKDLQASGLTLLQIGTLTGLAPSTVGDLATGRSASPRGEAAVKLHELHLDRCCRPNKRANTTA